MPARLCLPPVVSSRGDSPSQAAKSRPESEACPLPIAATGDGAVSGPLPGNSPARRQAAGGVLRDP